MEQGKSKNSDHDQNDETKNDQAQNSGQFNSIVKSLLAVSPKDIKKPSKRKPKK
jgi:hypothetical protein